MAPQFMCSRPYRRLIARCTLAVFLSIAVIIFSRWPPAAEAHLEQETQPATIRSHERTHRPQHDVTERKYDQAERDWTSQEPLDENEAVAEATLVFPTTSKSSVSTGGHPLDFLQTLLQDEYRKEAMLSPLEKTDEPLLRELAYRTRAFTTLFGAWEDLHFRTEGDRLDQVDVSSTLRTAVSEFMPIAKTVQTYDALRHFVHTFARRLFPWTMLAYPDHMALHAGFYNGGRGIVFTGGDHQAPLLLTVIPTLRSLGCQLPIEIFHLGESDLGEDSREELEKLPGVVTRDLTMMIDDDGWRLAGWAAKPFAILMSSFREAIFIDADSFFLKDPVELFSDEQYKAKGALFFKDRNLSPENKRLWLKSILPAPVSDSVKRSRMWTGESGHFQESGVIVVDKWRHFIPLLLATRLNGPDRDSDQATGKRGVYEMVYGDKETFWLSWELAGDLDYAFHGGLAGSMGKLATVYPRRDEDDSEASPKPAKGPMVCSPQLVHLDREGRPLWFNGWIATSKDSRTDWQQFDTFVIERPEVGRRPKSEVWTIFDSNVLCLEAEESFDFSSEEQKTLDAILRQGREVAAIYEFD